MEYGKYTGVAFGMASIKDSGDQFLLSGRIGTNLYENQGAKLALGLLVGTISYDESISGIDVTSTVTSMLSELVFRNIFSSGVYAGVRAGLTYIRLDVSAPGVHVTISDNVTTYGPLVGCEFPLTNRLNLSLEYSSLSMDDGEFRYAGQSIEFESETVTTLQIGFLYKW